MRSMTKRSSDILASVDFISVLLDTSKSIDCRLHRISLVERGKRAWVRSTLATIKYCVVGQIYYAQARLIMIWRQGAPATG